MHSVIIGGGFSGTLTALQLLRQATQPISVTLVEYNTPAGRGAAYGTVRPEHLLNVPAGRMGAFPEAPEDFHRWLVQHGHEYSADDFVPRMLYGEYLASLLAAAPEIRCINNYIISVTWDAATHQFHVISQSGEDMDADAVVLACGAWSEDKFPHALQAWRWFAGEYELAITESLLQSPEIFIAGSGLTMVDACITLKRMGYKGRIVAISRHGWLPASHQPSPPFIAPEWALNPAYHPQSAAQLLRNIRSAISQHGDWRGVIDALRPHTQHLWRALPPQQQKRIFQRLFTLWNIHRHRMAPSIAAEMEALLKSGQLELRHAHVKADTSCAPLIDCTGPSYDIRQSRYLLLRDLLEQGLIACAENGYGIATTSQLSAVGPAHTRLYAMGALTVGEWLECTAVPELRVQAQQVAHTILMQASHSD